MKCPNCKIQLLRIDEGKKTERLICRQCPYNIPLLELNTKKIDEFYTWLSVDTNGMEGQIGVQAQQGIYMVAQHSLKEVIQKMRPEILAGCKQTGTKAKLVRFVRAGVEEEVSCDD